MVCVLSRGKLNGVSWSRGKLNGVCLVQFNTLSTNGNLTNLKNYNLLTFFQKLQIFESGCAERRPLSSDVTFCIIATKDTIMHLLRFTPF